jgi:phosphoribosyl 1,2-cyclic phosphodiesterase
VVQFGGFTVCIDCGPDLRMQLLRAGIVQVDAVLLTHEHNDHVAGLDDLRPMIHRSGKPMPVYGLPRVLDALKARFSYVFSDEPYPGAPRIELCRVEAGGKVSFGGFDVLTLSVLHGPLEILGFKFGTAAYLTDVKKLPAETLNEVTGLERLVVSALELTPHWSHLSLPECLNLLDTLQPRQAWITHISHNMPACDLLLAMLPGNVQPGFDGLVIDFDWQPSLFDKNSRHTG